MPDRTSQRLQGTDGIRGPFMPQSEEGFRDLTPQEVFLRWGIITDSFMEVYLNAVLKLLVERSLLAEGDGVILAWDGRDREGLAISACIRAISKAGAKPILLGELDGAGRPIFGKCMPTPAAPLYMLHTRAKAAVMITASHNPAGQNGLKLFLAPWGLKPFPPDDDETSARILAADPQEVSSATQKESAENHYNQAEPIFIDYHLDPYNSWVREDTDLSTLRLVVDTANGALSSLAGRVFERLGVGEVEEVAGADVPINERSGVADLEGHAFIPAEQVLTKGERFSSYPALLRVMEWGRKLSAEIKAGRRTVSLASFDGDGDRFFRADYDPYNDGLVVLSGDETAVIQARFLAEQGLLTPEDCLYVNTVESDLGAAQTAKALGYQVRLVGVGDKWILREALSAHLQKLGISGVGIEEGLPRGMEICKELLGKKLSFEGELPILGLAVGSEETGHNITQGRIPRHSDGRYLPTFFGNGLKSAINTYVATAHLPVSGGKETLQFLRSPFTKGYKRNEYIFFSKKERFHRGSDAFSGLKKLWCDEWGKDGIQVEEVSFAEDKDMLYLALKAEGERVGALFARNSGTEPKTGIYLRGTKEVAPRMEGAETSALSYLYRRLKDWDHPSVIAQLNILGALNQADDRSLSEEDIRQILSSTLDRDNHTTPEELLLINQIKECIAEVGSAGWETTAKGELMLSVARDMKKDRGG